MRLIIDFEVVADPSREVEPLHDRSGPQQRQDANVIERERAVDRDRALDHAIERLEVRRQVLQVLPGVGAQLDEIADRLALAQRVVIERRHCREFGKAEQRIARPGERRRLPCKSVGPGGDFLALRPGEDRLTLSVDMTNHVHALEHGLAIVLYEYRDDALAHEGDHCVRVVIEYRDLPQMHALERRGHAHAKAQRAVLEHQELHAERFPCAAPAFADLLGGAQLPPPQQFSVRYPISAFIAAKSVA